MTCRDVNLSNTPVMKMAKQVHEFGNVIVCGELIPGTCWAYVFHSVNYFAIGS